MILTGTLQKLKGALDREVQYSLCMGETLLPLNGLLGNTFHFEFSGNIFCNHCGKKTKKSYQQGYCYICASSLARCDICIVRPEKCHFHLNTCREPEWGQMHCMIPHIVYLSNTSNLKVGITRETNIPTRWIDQGATQALPIARVFSRYHAGQLEVKLTEHVKDKTNWREMLKGCNDKIDLHKEYQDIRTKYVQDLKEKISPERPEKHISIYTEISPENENQNDNKNEHRKQNSDIHWLNETIQSLNYPVLAYPKKINSISVEKEKQFSSILQGIKGQYLILEKGVLNMRNLTGYELKLQIPEV